MMSNSNDFETGYRKPPKAHQFKKGKSGNPKGRPKKQLASDLESVLFQMIHEKIPVKEGGKRKLISKRDAMLKQIINGAAAGNMRMIQFLFGLAEKTERKQMKGLSLLSDAELDKCLSDITNRLEELTGEGIKDD